MPVSKHHMLLALALHPMGTIECHPTKCQSLSASDNLLNFSSDVQNTIFKIVFYFENTK